MTCVRKIACAAAAIANCIAIGSALSAPIDLPPEFAAVDLSPTLNEPVAMAFTGDGRLFVAERGGSVKVVQDGQVVSTFIDLQDEINNSVDRGLLGMALDPNFLSNHRVYLLYVVDPVFGQPDEFGEQASFSRLTRYEGTAASNGNVADPATRSVLIGASASEGIPACWSSHVCGALRFAADGSLLMAHGDSAQFDRVDPGTITPGCFAPGMFGSDQDIGAFRAQMLDSMNGKILRVDPNTGAGLPSNPYYQPAAPASPRSRVWISGLRNPYRFSVRPGTGSFTHPGTLYIGDVGWDLREEISVSVAGGENFGWPCHEAFNAPPGYPDVDLPQWDCATLETPANPGPLTFPLLAIHHFDQSMSAPPGYTGVCVTAGAFHVGDNYPSPYRGGFFYADNVFGWMRVARVSPKNQLLDVHPFATGAEGPVDFAIDPATGDLCYLSLFEGRAVRIRSLIGPGDVNRDGVVDVDDLIAIILAWGPCDEPIKCPEDLNVSGQVDVDDLIEVIVNWG